MQLKSLGLIETKGLAVGIEAADAAVKSANVELLGYELSKGGGWVTIKLQGDVGAVKAAIDAAKSVAMRTNGYVSARVIPRPSEALRSMLFTAETVGYEPVLKEEPQAPAETLPVEEVEKITKEEMPPATVETKMVGIETTENPVEPEKVSADEIAQIEAVQTPILDISETKEVPKVSHKRRNGGTTRGK